MASSEVAEGGGVGGHGGFPEGGEADSLFEGMVLIDASDLLPASSSPPRSPLPLPATPPPSNPQAEGTGAAPPAASSSGSISSPLPLDEDLFSDLTILPPSTPAQQPSLSLPPSDSPARFLRATPADLSPRTSGGSPTSEAPPLLVTSRQIPRKKKKAIRIGYARDAAAGWAGSAGANPAVEDQVSELPARAIPESYSSSTPQLESTSVLVPQPQSSTSPAAIEARSDVVVDRNSHPPEDSHDDESGVLEKVQEGHHPSEEAGKDEEEEQKPTKAPPEQDDSEEDPVSSMERKLDKVRAQISGKLSGIKETVTSLSEERKVLRRNRRNAADSVNAVTLKYKELERELEEACEVEDFERAERVSESLAAAENEKDDQLRLLRRAEEDCDAVDLKMQEILEMQISTEEESVALLEQFSENAADSAEKIMKNASEICSKEMEEWQLSIETLEARKLEMEIESHVVDEARSGLINSIDQLTDDDQKEKEMLNNKGAALAKELEELLALVRQKEAQIAENNAQILQVEERISKVVSEFQESQSTIIEKRRYLELALSEIESEEDGLSNKKKEIDDSLALAEQKSLRLKELAHVSVEEAKTCRDLVALRKSMSSYVLKSREDKSRLAKTEEQKSEEVHVLRQQISTSRSSLQELSSTRASIQEETTLLSQRIGFIDKRIPELEAEKKVAAAARNFKEAGRVAAEAKALSLEKESAQLEMDKGFKELERVEEEIRNIIKKIEESEELVSFKEKEAALAGWERLHLVAATARAEQSAAIESGDSEEGSILLAEAEAAESKARELQGRYGFELESLKSTPRCLLSIPMITNLSGTEGTSVKSDCAEEGRDLP